MNRLNLLTSTLALANTLGTTKVADTTNEGNASVSLYFSEPLTAEAMAKIEAFANVDHTELTYEISAVPRLPKFIRPENQRVGSHDIHIEVRFYVWSKAGNKAS